MPGFDNKSFEWFSNRLLFEGYQFRLQHFKDEEWKYGNDYFTFYKVRELVEEYRIFFSRFPAFEVKNLLELGVFQGGSIPFWNEIFKPALHVGLDLAEIDVSDYLQEYINDKKGLGRNITVVSGIDQADKVRLKNVVGSAFPGPLDLVIDDASHLYGPSRASFEVLFPMLRTGGLYIIEDWAWGHWTEFFGKDHFWAYETPPTKLISELVEFTGSDRAGSLIRSLTIFEGFVVIERGQLEMDGLNFRIDDHIKRKPSYLPPNVLVTRLKQAVKKLLGKRS